MISRNKAGQGANACYAGHVAEVQPDFSGWHRAIFLALLSSGNYDPADYDGGLPDMIADLVYTTRKLAEVGLV